MAIKTSAVKEYNTAVVKQSGRVGTVRYYNKNGMTYVRAASNSTVTNNRTNGQMTQRLMFSSLAALYSTLGNHLNGAFPNKAKNQSDFNAFMQANQGQGVYMTKQERALGYSVAMPVVVSAGKLHAITTAISGGLSSRSAFSLRERQVDNEERTHFRDNPPYSSKGATPKSEGRKPWIGN